MKCVVAIMLSFLSVSCRDDPTSTTASEEGERITPISDNIPAVEYCFSRGRHGDVLNLRINEGKLAYFWNWEPLGKESGDISEILDLRRGILAVTFRVWAMPETEFSMVRRKIKEALAAGVSGVELAVKNRFGGSSAGVLSIDVPLMGEGLRSALCGLVVRLNSDGQVSMQDEAGVAEFLEEPDELWQRIEMFKSVADTSETEMVINLAVDGPVGIGKFCEVLSILRQYSDYVFLLDYEREIEVPTLRKIPVRPIAPSSFPSIPKYR